MDRSPWDQLDGEPDEAYGRFLSYRNLGPMRTLREAAQSQLDTKPNAKKGKKPLDHVPGNYSEESGRWQWTKRANAWDIDNLKTQGTSLTIIWATAVTTAAQKVLEKLQDPKCKPTSFASALTALENLSRYVNPHALSGSSEPVPADHSGGEPRQLPEANGTIPIDRAAVA